MKPIKIDIYWRDRWDSGEWVVRFERPDGKLDLKIIQEADMATDPAGKPSIEDQVIEEGYAIGITIEPGEVMIDGLYGWWEKIDRTVGERIARRRHALGWRQSDAARAAKRSTSWWGDYERNRTEPNLKTLRHIARTLGCKVTDLIGEE